MHIIYIDRAPILHVDVDETKFCAGNWLLDASSKTIWNSFTNSWAKIYTGTPNRAIVEQRSILGKSSIFVSLGKGSNI